MGTQHRRVNAKGQIVIPADIRRKFKIEKGMPIAFVEENGRVFIQPMSDEFIDSMRGVLAGRNLPLDIEREFSQPVK